MMDRSNQHRLLKNIFFAFVFLNCTASAVLFCPLRIDFVTNALSEIKIKSSEGTSSEALAKGKRNGGIVGDPSRKRGFELGYDLGPKAGNEDRDENKRSAPFLRPEYADPEQFYRYEYGSRATFIQGFRNGFLLGYKWAFSKSHSAAPVKISDVEKTKTLDLLPNQITLATDGISPLNQTSHFKSSENFANLEKPLSGSLVSGNECGELSWLWLGESYWSINPEIPSCEFDPLRISQENRQH